MLLLSTGAMATNPLHLTVVGTLIAILFIFSIAGILGWMLRVPKETEHTRAVARVVRSVRRQSHILVPLLHNNEAIDRLVAIAAQMVRPSNGEVEVLVVIEVPFMLPLDASVEQDEKRACEALERAEAVVSQCMSKNRVKLRKRILKARRAGVAIVHEAEDQAVDMILMANLPRYGRGNAQQIDPAVEYTMKHAPCEVLVFSQGDSSIAQSRVPQDAAMENGNYSSTSSLKR